jgi:hypothetical protein
VKADELGRELCEAWGLPADRVAKMTIIIEAGCVPRVEMILYPDHDLTRQVIEQYELTRLSRRE